MANGAVKAVSGNSLVKYSLIQPANIVIDFGCAPGGWLQVASEKVGNNGLVLGIDFLKVIPPSKNTKTILADVNQSNLINLILKETQGKSNIILSDLSPKVSGIWELDSGRQIDLTMRVVSYLPEILLPSGSVILKAFDGEMFTSLYKCIQGYFNQVHLVKPPASRKQSSEIYIVGLKYLGKKNT